MSANFLGDIPGDHRYCMRTKEHAASTATEIQALMAAPFNCVLTDVDIISDTTVTGAATDITNLNILDGGADGTDTTELGNLDLASGTNLTAQTVTAIIDGGVTTLDEGDIIQLQFEKVSSGLKVEMATIVLTLVPN